MKDTVKYRGHYIAIENISSHPYDEQCDILKFRGNAIQYLNNPSEEQKLIAVTQNGYAIKHIPEPSYDVQKLAFSHQATAVQFVKDPYPELLQQAFMKDPNVLQHIKNPTYEQMVSAVSRKGGTIQYIKNPTAELINIAITQNPMAISYLTKPDNNLILSVIKRNPKSVKVIINRIPRELQIEALKRKGQLIKYIKLPDHELIETAVHSDPLAIQYVNNPSLQLQKEAILQTPNVLKFVDITKPDIQVEAVKRKQRLIYAIPNPSPQAVDVYESEMLKKDKVAKKEFATNGVYPSDHFYIKKKYIDFISHELLDRKYCEFINQYDEPISDVIEIITEQIAVQNIRIATGFLYKSGLNILNKTISPVVNTGGRIEFIIGSLQKYSQCISGGHSVTGMDYNTALYLRGLLNLNAISILTYPESFYHGKFYFLAGEEYTAIIMGSSNVSISGLRNNSELNSIYIYPNKDTRLRKYIDWYDKFKSRCEQITNIDLTVFDHRISETDHLVNQDKIGIDIDVHTFKEKIRNINDINVKERLALWLLHHPTHVFEQVDIDSFRDYILLEYQDKNLYVFESFMPGNAFYCFKCRSIQELLSQIRGKTKTQLFKTSEFYRRGYHINDTYNLKINIAAIF